MSPAINISAWPEDRILAYFWTMVREDADRLELLSQIAVVAVRRDEDWSREQIREEHDATKRHASTVRQCFCCRTGDRRLYWHHVIAIQHGGSNALHNKVAICLRCHATVHPWLEDKADPRPKRSSWMSMHELLKQEFGKSAGGGGR